MDAYEVHKKIQETITLVDIYQTLAVRSSQWDTAIEKGLKELSEKGQNLFTPLFEICPTCAGSGRRIDKQQTSLNDGTD